MGKDWATILENLRSGDRWRIINYLHQLIGRFRDRDGIKVPDEDWDYLIILDACRYDVFEHTHDLPGELRKVISRGSSSNEFLNNNFTDYYGDIVYFSTNSFVSPTDHGGFDSSKHFFHVEPVYLRDDLEEEKDMQTPEAVVEYFLEHEDEYPHKRKILHLMQPHGAYIGDYQVQKEGRDVTYLWNDYPRDKIWKAYISNLERVLEQVAILIEELDGKIVVTADHGEGFGEKGVVGHPAGVRTSELVEVPWLEIETGDRPEIEAGDITDIDI